MSAALLDARGYPSAPAVIDYLTALGYAVGLPYSEPPILLCPQGDRLLLSREQAGVSTFRDAVKALESAGLRVSEAVSFSHDQRVYLR